MQDKRDHLSLSSVDGAEVESGCNRGGRAGYGGTERGIWPLFGSNCMGVDAADDSWVVPVFVAVDLSEDDRTSVAALRLTRKRLSSWGGGVGSASKEGLMPWEGRAPRHGWLFGGPLESNHSKDSRSTPIQAEKLDACWACSE